jgi:uncharacterized protein (TIGR02466 family)
MSDNAPSLSKAQFANLFTTPLLTHTWEDSAELNALLRKHILEQEKNDAGVVNSNHGGWHSKSGQLEFCGDAGQRLVRHMYQFADEATKRVFAERGRQYQPIQWVLSAWVNVNRRGNFNRVHVHPGSTWSGTYYVDAGDPESSDPGALLYLSDPCPGRGAIFLPTHLPSSFKIVPKAGLMILFPSYVPHMVYPHYGNGERISIAFNLRNVPYP